MGNNISNSTVGIVANNAPVYIGRDVIIHSPQHESFAQLSVPRASHPFQGREEVIKTLDKLYFNEGKRKVVISGLAGYGKTELAKHYANHVQESGNVKRVVWVVAETTDNLEEKYIILKEAYTTFKNEICLFVFDNGESKRALSKYLPPNTTNSLVLITSQYTSWGDDVVTVPLKPLDRDTSFIIFELILGKEKYNRLNKGQLEDIVKFVHDIPLGLVVIAGHLRDQMEASGKKFDLQSYQKEVMSSSSLQQDIEASVDSTYDKNLTTAIYSMLNKMITWLDAKKNIMTDVLLCVSAHLDPDRIFIDDMKEILDIYGENDSDLIDRCVHTVRKFSFIDYFEEVHSERTYYYFKIHRMCQDILRNYYNDDKFKKKRMKEECYNACLHWVLRQDLTLHRAVIFKNAFENKTVVNKTLHEYYKSNNCRRLRLLLTNLVEYGGYECLVSFLGGSEICDYVQHINLLHKAAKTRLDKTIQIMELLLKKGSDIHSRDRLGYTALHWATSHGRETNVRFLLERGSDIDASTTDGWLYQLRSIQPNGRDVRASVGNSPGATALHFAASKGHTQICNLLLEKGSNVKARTKDGWTALHWAAQGGHTDIVTLLLQDGSDVHSRDENGFTAFHRAAYNEHIDAVRVLLIHGSDVNTRNNNGQPALDLTYIERHVELARVLQEYKGPMRGADAQ